MNACARARILVATLLCACSGSSACLGQNEEQSASSSQGEAPAAEGIKANGRDALTALGAIRPQRPPSNRGGRAIHIMDLQLIGDQAYLGGAGGAFPFDLSNAEQPEQLAMPTSRALYWVAEAGEQIVVAGRTSGLARIAMGTDASWTVEAEHQDAGYTPEGVAVYEGHVFVAAQEDGLAIHDLESLAPVASSKLAVNAIDVVVQAGIAYVADRELGLVLLDISAPETPKLLGQVETPGSIQHLEVHDGFAYLAAGALLVVVAVEEPSQPRVVKEIQTHGVATGVAIEGDALALANWSDTRLFDISQPDAPRLIGVEDATDSSMAVAFEGDLLAVADWDYLRTYRVDMGAAGPEISLPYTLTLQGEGTQQAAAVIRNDGLTPLEVFDLTCDRLDLAADRQQLLLEPGADEVVILESDLGDGDRWTAACTFWSDDVDEPLASLSLVANPTGLSVGDMAPDWTLPDLEGTMHGLRGQRGEVVLLTIFSSL